MKRPSPLDSALIRLGTSMANRGGKNAALAVLMFHRVLPEPDPLLPSEPDASTFSVLMDTVASHFNVLDLTDAVRRLRDGSLPPRAVCVTFDDGYANNCTVALPILAAKGIRATVFVASGFLEGGRMFNDTIIEAVRIAPGTFDLADFGLGAYLLPDDEARIHAINDIIRKIKHIEPSARSQLTGGIAARAGLRGASALMMTHDQVRRLHRAGIEVGAHTVSHPILVGLGAEAARHEITAGKHELEAIIGARVSLFAYPNGKPASDYDGRHVAIAMEAGFEAAFSTVWGTADRSSDMFQIPRIAPWGGTPLRYGLQIAASYRRRN